LIKKAMRSKINNGIFDQDGGLGGRVAKDKYVRGGRGMLKPARIKDEKSFYVMANQMVDPLLLELFNELQGIKTNQQVAYEQVLTIGKIPTSCKDGTFPAFAKFYRTSAA